MEESTNASVRPTVIEWQTGSSESRTEQSSPDNRWHLDTKTVDGKTRSYLTNYDILCSPSAFGSTVRECWENYLKNCDEYAAKLAAIRAEAEAILTNLPEDNQ